jgi:uncharacterized protein involved in propanediol utilization
MLVEWNVMWVFLYRAIVRRDPEAIGRVARSTGIIWQIYTCFDLYDELQSW